MEKNGIISVPYVKITLHPQGGALGMTKASVARVNPQCDILRVRSVFMSSLRKRAEGNKVPSHQAVFFQALDPQTKTVVPVFDCNSVSELAQKYSVPSPDGEPCLTLLYQCQNTFG